MRAPHADLALDHQLCFPLYAGARAVTRLYGELLADEHLTYPQYVTLLALWDADGVSVGELGERLHLDSGTLTPLLKRMEKAGHLQRTRDPDDERRVVITVTDAGWELRERVSGVPARMGAALGLSDEEIDVLRAGLKKMLANLDG